MRGSSRLAGARLLCLLAFAVWSPCPAQVEQGARFLIIAADSFAPAAQTLADWRTATGQQAAVRTLSQTGASPTQVRTYIRNAWNTWPVKPEYVLLLCSPTQLPGYGYDNDCYYGDMTGDYLMEIPVGRIPAWNLSECRTMLAKTLAYEKLAGWSDSSWVLRGSTVIGEDNPGNPDTLYWPDCFYAHDRWTAHGYTRADSFYNLWGHTTSQLNSALNNGRSFMTYRGVGQSTWYYPFHTFLPGSSWRNGFRTPIFVGATCATVTVAPGEEMLGDLSVRFGTPESLGGAVAYFGTSRSDIACSHYRSACYRGFFKALFDEGVTELGPATVRGRWRCDSLYRNQFHYEEWTLIGDPGLRVWTGPVRRPAVTHPAWVSAGPQNVEVTVTAGGSPVPEAFVCLWLDSVVYRLDTTDAQGRASLAVNPTHPGRMRLTVTGANLRPYEGICEVHVTGQPFVAYLSHSVVDQPPAGNGDGMVGAGETITLPLWVKNLGDLMSAGTTARLRLADPYVALLDTIRSFGTIPGHDSAFTGPSGFRLFVSPSCPEGRVLGFALHAADSSGRTWTSDFQTAVVAVILAHASDSIDDLAGNGNHRLDPEETANLIVALRNDGSAAALQTTAVLRTTDPRLVILDSVGTWGIIPRSGTRQNTADKFTLRALDMVPETRVACTLLVTGTCFSCRIPFTITVGELSQFDPIADGPRQPPLYWAYDDLDRRYPPHPDFNWIELRGTGTSLGLGDNQTVQLDLPPGFGPFKYYGRRYTRLSVCSNGWVAPGYTTYTGWGNTRLPRRAAPAMLAPCWDDLYPPRGGNVLYQFDTTNHRLIIEWDSVHYRTPADRWDRFQLVIYDTTLSAADGNSVFDFQYKTANGYRYATVGIQDTTYQIGITCLCDTLYHRAAAPVWPGRAIRFTTDVPIIGIAGRPPLAVRPSPSAAVRPNPTRGRCRVQLAGFRALDPSAPLTLSVCDISGRAILHADLCLLSTDFALDLRHLPAGLYFLRLRSGSQTATTRLVLTR